MAAGAWEVEAIQFNMMAAPSETFTIRDGWEPFAVFQNAIWVRRQLPADTEPSSATQEPT